VPLLQLLLWVRTRWASLYNFLDRILVLRKASKYFFAIFSKLEVLTTCLEPGYQPFYTAR